MVGIHVGLRHQNLPLARQQPLKQPPRAARARVVAAQLLREFLVPLDDTAALLDLGLGGEALAALACYLKRKPGLDRSEEHTSALQSLMRISYAFFCLK